MKKILNRKCPICGKNKGEILYNISMKLPKTYIIQGEYDIVACEECGFIYADVKCKQEKYNEYYKNCNMYSNIFEVKKEVYNNIRDYKVEFIVKYINKNDKILDMGCGSGDLLKELKKKGFNNLYAIDPSEKSIQSLAMEGISGRVGNIFDEIPLELQNKFDVVCCTGVMEHLYDVGQAVSNLMKYMNHKKGKLFVEVPAVEGFEKYVAEIPNYFNHEHINYFSIRSLDNLFALNKLVKMNDIEDCYFVYNVENDIKEMVIRGLYGFCEENSNYEKDILSIESVKRYFKKINQECNSKFKMIREIINKEQKIIIWGTGSYAMWLVQQLPEIGENLHCFVDNNKQKQEIELCGKPVYGPEYLRKFKEKTIILICSMQSSREIVNQIEKMKIDKEYLIL